MNVKNVAVIIPYYSNQLTYQEEISLKQMCKIFWRHDMILVAPDSLNITVSLEHNYRIERFPNKFFIGRAGYNSLMLSPLFYERFIQYKYILICQMDVFIFEDRLDYFCGLGYDYIGAPWLRGVKSYEGNGYEVCYVGNGGLSLRKTQSMISLLLEKQPERFFWEDYFISSYKNKLNIPSVDIALDFAFEGDIKTCLEMSKKWPMGIHGWWRFDFESVKSEIQKYGYDVSGINDEKFDERTFILNYKNLDMATEYLKKQIKSIFPCKVKDNICVWGAGYYGDIMGWVLKKAGIENFMFVDKSIKIIGKRLYDKKIISPNEITSNMIDGNIWIICSEKYMDEISDELYNLGVSRENVLLYIDILKCFNMNKKVTYEN